MASYGLSVQGDHVRSTIAEAKSLTVDRLKKVLRSENLQVSGIKSELQIRLIAHIQKCADQGEHDRVSRIRNSIRGVTGSYPNPYPSPYSANTPTTSLSPQFQSPTPRPPPPMPTYPMPSYSSNRITFTSSPFYTIIKPLATVQEVKARESTRDTARISIILDMMTIDQIQRDPNVRVMVFCAADSPELRLKPCEISFPLHGELKCNSNDVKANLKGLKNKSGTTRAVDITEFMRKKVNFPNMIELVYALTKTRYFLVVNLVQKKPVDNLLSELRRGRFMSKERVVKDIQSKASDPDIVATSSVMSLKDPVQMTRIQTPCRSINCRHNECFDAAAYLYLQEQAPTWKCPCCNRDAPWENLVFDQYFDDILQNVSSDTDQVTVEPDGQWHVEDDQNVSNNNGGHDDDDDDYDDDDDDDLVMISGPRANQSKEFLRTPSLKPSPPAQDHSPMATAQQSNKRKHVTIDLTESDSDDDQASRRPPAPKPANINACPFPLPNQYHTPRLSPFTFQMPPPSSSMNNGYRPGGYYTG